MYAHNVQHSQIRNSAARTAHAHKAFFCTTGSHVRTVGPYHVPYQSTILRHVTVTFLIFRLLKNYDDVGFAYGRGPY